MICRGPQSRSPAFLSPLFTKWPRELEVPEIQLPSKARDSLYAPECVEKSYSRKFAVTSVAHAKDAHGPGPGRRGLRAGPGGRSRHRDDEPMMQAVAT